MPGKYNPNLPTEPTLPATTSELQTTKDDALKYMFLITITAIVASIIITYLLTRR